MAGANHDDVEIAPAHLPMQNLDHRTRSC
jgi:hypothetical protein